MNRGAGRPAFLTPVFNCPNKTFLGMHPSSHPGFQRIFFFLSILMVRGEAALTRRKAFAPRPRDEHVRALAAKGGHAGDISLFVI